MKEIIINDPKQANFRLITYVEYILLYEDIYYLYSGFEYYKANREELKRLVFYNTLCVHAYRNLIDKQKIDRNLEITTYDKVIVIYEGITEHYDYYIKRMEDNKFFEEKEKESKEEEKILSTFTFEDMQDYIKEKGNYLYLYKIAKEKFCIQYDSVEKLEAYFNSLKLEEFNKFAMLHIDNELVKEVLERTWRERTVKYLKNNKPNSRYYKQQEQEYWDMLLFDDKITEKEYNVAVELLDCLNLLSYVSTTGMDIKYMDYFDDISYIRNRYKGEPILRFSIEEIKEMINKYRSLIECI